MISEERVTTNINHLLFRRSQKFGRSSPPRRGPLRIPASNLFIGSSPVLQLRGRLHAVSPGGMSKVLFRSSLKDTVHLVRAGPHGGSKVDKAARLEGTLFPGWLRISFCTGAFGEKIEDKCVLIHRCLQQKNQVTVVLFPKIKERE